MATTTNFGWETPDDTDLVKDGAAAIRTLGSNIDTSLVDLKGGTTGQVLAKNSNTDMDFVWSADAAGMTNPMTTTGDVIYSSSGSTPARLGIGTSGQLLSVGGSGIPAWTNAPSSGGITLIAETVASGLSSLSFSSIPSTYKDLFLVWQGLYTSNDTNNRFVIRFNADSGDVYRSQSFIFQTTGSLIESGGTSTAVGEGALSMVRHNTNTTNLNRQWSGNVSVYNYASNTKYKRFNLQTGGYYEAAAAMQGGFVTGNYASTTAITSINIERFAGAGTFTNSTDTSIRLYGVS